MILAPFPYKILADSIISNGYIFSIPQFCIDKKDNPKCKEFYHSLKENSGFHTCPYGFAVECTKLGGVNIIFTCLNIDKKTDRKITRKLNHNIDQTLRMTINEYNSLKDNFDRFFQENQPTFDVAAKYTKDSSQLKLDKELLDNTIHELRKLNTQLKGVVTKLNPAISQLRNKTEYIETLNLDIYSISNLMSIRLDTYDLEVNPILNLSSNKREIAIYKKIEKVYKCLNAEAKRKNVGIYLDGKSYNLFSASNSIEIAFFIVLENAIKYSIENETIKITFKETEDRLTLTFMNWGIRPGDDEIKKLTDRNYRSRNVINRNVEEGRGIGLYLLNQICSVNDIQLKIKLGNDNKYHNGYRYSPFFVEMKFDGMIQHEDGMDDF